MRRFRPSPALLVAIVALVAAAGGFAVASIPSGNGTVHACYQKENGQLRVVDKDANQACRPSERALTLNQRGPTGPTGPRGPAGPAGPPGGGVTHKSVKLGEVSTRSETRVPLDGPSVTFTVPAGGATVLVAASVEGSTNPNNWRVFLDGDPSPVRDQSDVVVHGGQGYGRASSYAVPLPAGTYTFRFMYQTFQDPNEPFAYPFRNRRLHVTVLP
jgi:hypothetical protein